MARGTINWCDKGYSDGLKNYHPDTDKGLRKSVSNVNSYPIFLYFTRYCFETIMISNKLTGPSQLLLASTSK